MRSSHPETELIPYLRGELATVDRERVGGHLEGCASCRETLESFRAILAGLRAEAPASPEIDWRRYRAELRDKLEERSRGWAWSLPRLAPVAATAAIAGLALVFTLRSHLRHSTPEDLPVFEETAIGSHLEMLQNYPVVENLDLLEDLDVVQDLDRLTPVDEG